MYSIRVNDIFEELSEENKRLLNELLFANKCLNLLIRFKSFVVLNSHKLKTNLNSNDCQVFENLFKEVEEVMKERQMFSNNFINNKEENGLTLGQEIQTQNKVKSNSIVNKVIEVKQKTTKPNENQLEDDSHCVQQNNNSKTKLVFKSKRNDLNENSVKKSDKTYTKRSKKFICDLNGCGFRTKCRQHLRNHMNGHNGIKPFKCSSCHKSLSTKESLKQHIEKFHQLSDQLLICDFNDCNKTFKSEASLKFHRKRYHFRTAFICCDYPNCNFKTFSRFSLNIHMAVHTDNRPFICHFEGCGKAFKTEYVLNSHKKLHCNPTPVKCNEEGCHSVFNSEYLLKKHLRRIHPKIPLPKLVCDWPGCEYQTTDSHRLKMHYLLHSDERNFCCDSTECRKKFKSKQHLERHLRIHKLDKRYVCSWPGCQYRCVQSNNLKIHLRVHQKN